MAKRLTDEQKKSIIAHYVECQSYRETARAFDVSNNTVKRVVENNEEMSQKCTEKKRRKHPKCSSRNV